MYMEKDIVFEEFDTNFTVALTNSTVTPVFQPSSRSGAQFYFEVCYKNYTSFKYDYDSKCNKENGRDEMKIFLHGNQTNSTVRFITAVSYEKMYDPFKVFESSRFNSRSALLHIFSDTMIDGSRTQHGLQISTGKIRLKSKFFIGGHLGTVSSLSKLNSTVSSQSSLLRNFATLLESQIMSDLTIHVEDKTLRAHKVILAAQSVVFQKMFEHDFLESKTNTVEITDATFEVFEFFLKYLYSGELSLASERHIDALYTLADKYQVVNLKADCVRTKARCIGRENIYEILPLAYDCNEDEVKNSVKSFVVQNFPVLEPTPEWKDFVKSHPYIGYDIVTQVHAASKFIPMKKNTLI